MQDSESPPPPDEASAAESDDTAARNPDAPSSPEHPDELRRIANQTSVGCISTASGGAGLLSLAFAIALLNGVIERLTAGASDGGTSILGVVLLALSSLLFLTFALLLIGLAWAALGQLKSPPVRRGMPWMLAALGLGTFGLVLTMVGLTEVLDGNTGQGIATIGASLPAWLLSMMAVRVRTRRREVQARHSLTRHASLAS